MSLFRRPKGKEGPVATSTPPMRISSWTNISVTPSTSLQKVAVWAAMDLICSLVSELPLEIYKGRGSGKKRLEIPPYLEDPGGDGQGRADWVWQLLSSMLLRGNSVGKILDRARKGSYPTAIEWLHPDRVQVSLSAKDWDPLWTFEGHEIPKADVAHFRAFPIPGELLGMSPIQYHSTTIGMALAVTQFGRQWFSDGAHPSGMLTNSEVELNDKQSTTIKARFRAALYGTREPLVMGKGWDYKAIQIAPEESQFLETQQFSSADCARIFGPGMAEILGYESGGNLTYANIESRFTHLLVLALNRWLLRTERVFTKMLPHGQYARLDRDALLQPTTLDRLRAYKLAADMGLNTLNELREREDWLPVPWGDEPMAMQMARQKAEAALALAEEDDDDDPEDPEAEDAPAKQKENA